MTTQNLAPVPTMLRRVEVEAMTGMSRAGIYKAMGQKRFPKPVKISARAVRWHRSEILEWLDSRPRVAEYSAAN